MTAKEELEALYGRLANDQRQGREVDLEDLIQLVEILLSLHEE